MKYFKKDGEPYRGAMHLKEGNVYFHLIFSLQLTVT